LRQEIRAQGILVDPATPAGRLAGIEALALQFRIFDVGSIQRDK
jgi:hypothetical protein